MEEIEALPNHHLHLLYPLQPPSPSSTHYKLIKRRLSIKKSSTHNNKTTSKKLKEEIRSLEKQKEELTRKVADFEETIYLNVGGVLHDTTKTTLLKQRDNLLSSMFSGRYQLAKDPEGRYFIDRDGHIFRYILNYLRSGHIADLSRTELLLLRPEAEFFRIKPLLKIIDDRLKDDLKSKFAVLRYNENSNVNHLSWQGKTEPCKLTTVKNLYKCIDEVLTEVDSRGWKLLQMCGDGGSEGGWMYVFKQKPLLEYENNTKKNNSPDDYNDDFTLYTHVKRGDSGDGDGGGSTQTSGIGTGGSVNIDRKNSEDNTILTASPAPSSLAINTTQQHIPSTPLSDRKGHNKTKSTPS